ncbi:ABC transporter permease [Intestinimonas sp. HCP28S3_D6]|uniref:ABC transporter permease n=1 Tax=Intestinimonas sp. HCP28S3_D6 TaxID=3438942 RepID=UPI003F88BB81
MLDYLRAECYKMLHRSYLWIALLIVGGLELVLVLLWAWLNGDAVNMTASAGFTMVLYLLSAGYYATAITSDIVFSDQYKCNTLKNEVACGLPRSRIYLGKLFASCLLSIGACAVLLGWYALLCALLLPGDGAALEALKVLGFALLCAFPVWLGSQAFYLFCFFSIRGNTAATIVSVCIIALFGQMLTFLSLLVSLPAPALADALLAVRGLLLTTPLENITDAIWDWSRVGWAWAVGAGWCVGTTALGLWCFRRREIS